MSTLWASRNQPPGLSPACWGPSPKSIHHRTSLHNQLASDSIADVGWAGPASSQGPPHPRARLSPGPSAPPAWGLQHCAFRCPAATRGAQVREMWTSFPVLVSNFLNNSASHRTRVIEVGPPQGPPVCRCCAAEGPQQRVAPLQEGATAPFCESARFPSPHLYLP